MFEQTPVIAPPSPPPAPPPGGPPLPPPGAKPAQWPDLIRVLAQKHRVNPRLALAIAEAESNFDPAAVSPVGAIGLMQLMPETAKRLGVDPHDPMQNIEGGMREIRRLLDENSGNIEQTLRFYNGSPQAPRAATDPYVQKVMALFGRQVVAEGPQTRPEAWRPGSAEEVARETAPRNTPPAPPPGPPWYEPEQLLNLGKELGIGAAKSVSQLVTNLGRLPHLIPGVSSAVDWLYGTPGLSANAFPAADEAFRPSNRAQGVGKVGTDIITSLYPGVKAAGAAAKATAVVAPRLTPYVGSTVARIAPRLAIEAPAAAGIAAVQGQDPGLAAGIAAAIPIIGQVLRYPLSGALSPVAQRAIDFGKAEGIPIDAAIETANRWVKNIQTGLENTPIGGAVRAAAERKRDTRMTSLGERLADDVYPTSTTPIQAGKSVGDALDARVTALGARAKAAYQQVERIHASPRHRRSVPSGQVDPISGAPIMVDMQLPIELAPIRRALRPVLDALMRQPVNARLNSPALPALQSLFRGGPFRPLLDLEKDLGAIKRLADASGGLRTPSQGLGSRGVRELQGAIDDAARQADPQLLSALQEARLATRFMHRVDKLGVKFMGTAKDRSTLGTEPMKGYDKVLQGGDAHVAYLKQVAREVGPTEMRKLGRGYLQDLLETATEEGGYQRAAAIANRWKTLGDETKGLLYTRDHIDALDNFFRLGRLLAEHPNPSRSGVFSLSNLMLVGIGANPLWGGAATLGTGALAVLMHHPTGVRLLTQGLTLPGGTPAAAQWAGQVRAFLDEHPPESADHGEDVNLPKESPGARRDVNMPLRVGAPPPAPPPAAGRGR